MANKLTSQIDTSSGIHLVPCGSLSCTLICSIRLFAVWSVGCVLVARTHKPNSHAASICHFYCCCLLCMPLGALACYNALLLSILNFGVTLWTRCVWHLKLGRLFTHEDMRWLLSLSVCLLSTNLTAFPSNPLHFDVCACVCVCFCVYSWMYAIPVYVVWYMCVSAYSTISIP